MHRIRLLLPEHIERTTMDNVIDIDALFASEYMVKLEGETLSSLYMEDRKFRQSLSLNGIIGKYDMSSISGVSLSLYQDTLNVIALSYEGEILSAKNKRRLKQVIAYIKEYGRRFMIMVRKWIDKAAIYIHGMEGLRLKLLSAVENDKYKDEITIPNTVLNQIKEFLFDKTDYGYGASFMTFDKGSFNATSLSFPTLDQIKQYLDQNRISYPVQEVNSWEKTIVKENANSYTLDIGESVRGSSPVLIRCYNRDGLIINTVMFRVRFNLIVLKYLPNTVLKISDAWLDKVKLELELKQTRKARLKAIDVIYDRIGKVFSANADEYIDEAAFHKDALARSKYYYILMTDVNRRFKDAINVGRTITDYK